VAGTTSLIAPVVAAGADVITPSGLGVGGGGLLVVIPGGALGGATARVGLYGRGRGSQGFLAVELAAVAETDCCGGSTGYTIAAGVTRWRGRDRALRFEGRLFLPFRGEGGPIMVQVGMTFRPKRTPVMRRAEFGRTLPAWC
jgi:hypothetical protein